MSSIQQLTDWIGTDAEIEAKDPDKPDASAASAQKISLLAWQIIVISDDESMTPKRRNMTRCAFPLSPSVANIKANTASSASFVMPSDTGKKELKRKRTREGGAGEQAGADRRAEDKILHPDDKEGPGSGPRHGTPKTPFCPHALLPTDKQRLIFERNEAAAAVDAEAAVVLRSEAAAAFAAYIAAEAAATAAKVRCVEAAAAAAAHDEAAVVRRVQNKTLEPKLAAYNVEREQTKLAGMLSDDLLEGASAITRGARGGEQEVRPQGEARIKPSSALRSTRGLQLSPSVANIKAKTANSASVVIPSAVQIMPGAFSDTGKKGRTLFTPTEEPRGRGGAGEQAGADRRAEGKILQADDKAVIYAAAQASKKFAGMLSDDLLEGTRANARGARGGEQEVRPQGQAKRIKAYDPTAHGPQDDDEEDSPLWRLPAANTCFNPRRDILADATSVSNAGGRAHVRDASGGVSRRPFTWWTPDEEQALHEGVEAQGEGKWKEIQEGSVVLKNRTTVDCKDKWRNMKKKWGVDL